MSLSSSSSLKTAVAFGVSLGVSLGVSYAYYTYLTKDEQEQEATFDDDVVRSSASKPTDSRSVPDPPQSTSPSALDTHPEIPSSDSRSGSVVVERSTPEVVETVEAEPLEHKTSLVVEPVAVVETKVSTVVTETSPKQESPPVYVRTVVDEADELYEAGKHQEVYNLLKRARPQSDNSARSQVLWRLARACNDLSSVAASTGNTARQQALVEEGYEAAQRALSADSGPSQPHKWAGIMLSSVGAFKSTKDKIADAYTIRDHIVAAIERNPQDPTCEYVYGEWCFALAALSWVERRAAALIFGTPPESTVEEALVHFKRADEISPGFYKKNTWMISQCYQRLKDKKQASDWARAVLRASANKGGATMEDNECDAEARKFLGM